MEHGAEKLRLEVAGLAGTGNAKDNVKLMLAGTLPESDRTAFLCFGIGLFEAQAIGMEIENYQRIRPFTHDLFKNVLVQFGHKIDEVLIYDFRDEVFYANIIIDGQTIDSRPSDAIAMALRFNAPIYINTDIFTSQAETIPNFKQNKTIFALSADYLANKGESGDPLPQLKQQLAEVIKAEDYENAARLRDEIKRLEQKL